MREHERGDPRRLLALVVALLVFLPGSGCARHEVEPGTRLLYGVDYLGLEQYDFDVTVRALAPDLVLDYATTGDSIRNAGRATVREGALRTAHRQHNYFGGDDYDLTDQTTVWVSDAVFEALASGQPAPIHFGGEGEPEETLRAVGRTTLPVTWDGRRVDLDVLHGTTERGHALWVWDNAARPVIVRMDVGWTITLREVQSAGRE